MEKKNIWENIKLTFEIAVKKKNQVRVVGEEIEKKWSVFPPVAWVYSSITEMAQNNQSQAIYRPRQKGKL